MLERKPPGNGAKRITKKLLAKRVRPVNIDPFYHQMWRIVDGAIRKTFQDHPDYIREGKSERSVRQSISKRVVGALSGYVGTERRSIASRRRTEPVE